MKTPWGRAVLFYFAFLWRGLLLLAVLMILFQLFYWIILMALEQHPLAERLVRFILILSAAMSALIWGLQWVMGARFGIWSLRVVDLQSPSEPPNLTPKQRLKFGQALKVVWAHVWRQALISLPLNVALQWLLFRRLLIQPTDWQSLFEFQLVNIPLGVLIGIWTMRIALHLRYRDFELKWVESATTPTPNTAEPA
jgi:hypothetical protein